MSRVKVTEKTVYSYAELSDSAKEHAREKFGQWGWDDGTMQENCQMIADDILEAAGFEAATGLSYQLYVQSNGVTFETRSASPVFVQPATPGLRRKRYDVRVGTRHCGGGSYAFEIEVFDPKDIDQWDSIGGEIYESARGMIQDLAREIERAFYAEDEYQQSDEVVAENCEANGYEFTESGDLA